MRENRIYECEERDNENVRVEKRNVREKEILVRE